MEVIEREIGSSLVYLLTTLPNYYSIEKKESEHVCTFGFQSKQSFDRVPNSAVR